MKRRNRVFARYFAAGFLLLLTVGLTAPFFQANGFRNRLIASLESALGRKVEIKGEVRFDLFTGPGFSVSDVVIHEDPAFGIEPFAYVASLEARPRLVSLWSGRLELASLRLAETSVNLVRTETPSGSTRWNFEPFLSRSPSHAMPDMRVRSGRINFKFGDTKSAFYLTNTILDVDPPSPGGTDWQLQFSGEPARTDRPARGFGNLIANGIWSQKTSSAASVVLEIRLEKSAIAELITLLYGHDVGLHGVVSSRARLAGPISDIKIVGHLDIEDVHRWDQMPPKGARWPLAFQGRLDLPSQILELESQQPANEPSPLSVRFRASDYLSRPHWGVALNWNRFPVEPLLEVARHMGAPLPDRLRLAGSFEGAVGYTGHGSLQGQLAFHDAAVTIPDSPPIRFEHAKLLFDRGRIHLAPSLVRTANEDEAELEADYVWGTQALDLTIASDSMNVASLRSQAALAAIPLLEQVRSGTWRGQLRYQYLPDSPAGWTGRLELKQAEIPVAAFSEPLRVESASAQLNGARIVLERIRARVGEVRFHGDYRYEPELSRPHRFRASISELKAAEAERLLMPVLRPKRGLIARALGIGRAPLPDWLRTSHVDGTIQIGSLTLANVRLEAIRTRVLWDALRLELADLEARVENGRMAGRLSVSLRGGSPAYRLAVRLKSANWSGGKMDADALIETAGIGRELLANLRSEGSFTGKLIDLQALPELQKISGCFKLQWNQKVPRVQFTELQLSTGTELYIGRGSTQDDGRLLVQVASGDKQLRMTGTLARLHLEEPATQ